MIQLQSLRFMKGRSWVKVNLCLLIIIVSPSSRKDIRAYTEKSVGLLNIPSHKITSQIISRLRSHLRSQTGLTPNRKRGTCRGIYTQRRDSFSFTHSQPQHVQSSSTHPKRCRLGTGGRLHLVHTHPLCEALLLAMDLPRGQNRQKSPFAKLAPGHTRLSPSGSRPQATPEAALSQN